MLKAHRPMGFIGLSALLAARVLGPGAGVRMTLGSKAIAGREARRRDGRRRAARAPLEDVIVDQKARVYSTPGFLAEGARLAGVARAIDRLVRAVVANAKDRAPADQRPRRCPRRDYWSRPRFRLI